MGDDQTQRQPIDAYYLRGALRGVIGRDLDQREWQRSGNRGRRFYTRANFEEAWARYIPRDPVNDPVHPVHPEPPAEKSEPEPNSVAPDQGDSSDATQDVDTPRENGVAPDAPDAPDAASPDASIYAGNGAADPAVDPAAGEHAGERCDFCGVRLGAHETAVRHEGKLFHFEACLAEHIQRQGRPQA